MKTNELRIGSYYNYDGDSIKLDGSTLASYLQNDMDLYLEPIPLTEEWLLKFRFYYSDDENEFLELQLMHKTKLYADNSNNFSTAVLRIKENEIKIKYVHQLQNLYFVLTNEELRND